MTYGEGGWMARGSVVDEFRVITAKIPVTPHDGYLDYEQVQTSSQTIQLLCIKWSLSTEVQSGTEKKYRDHLVATWTTIKPRCAVNKAKNQPLTSHQSFKSGGTPSCRLHPAAQLAGVMRDKQGHMHGSDECPSLRQDLFPQAKNSNS